jgi:SAM-dependent methyltransferase
MSSHRASPARIARSLDYRLRDALDTVMGRADPLVPPRRSAFVGPGDFRAVGDELLGLLIERAGLRSDERVLDVGCGIGRLARPLTGYLSPAGRYAGFDVVPAGITWCRDRIAPRFPGFRFELADVRNAAYNPAGATNAADYRFPYPDASFDLAAATSLFTHLPPAAAANYLRETARVLAPGGRLLATFFVLDDEARAALAEGRADHRFEHALDAGAWTADPATPERAVAYEPGWIERELTAAGLAPRTPFGPGSWCGRPAPLTYQDVVVADR